MTFYALWDTVTANLAGEYPSEAAARTALRAMVKAAGPDALAGYALLRDDDDEAYDPVLVADGAALAALARGGGMEGGDQ